MKDDFLDCMCPPGDEKIESMLEVIVEIYDPRCEWYVDKIRLACAQSESGLGSSSGRLSGEWIVIRSSSL
jgi:hypothetical protein